MSSVGVDEIGAALQRFGWPDYLVFILMLLICVIIGIYFGFFHVAKNAQDYLVGGRTMNTFPVAMSLLASFISGISLLGIPTEIYVYGIQYFYIGGGVIVMGIVTGTIYLPVFHNLQLTSSYEYLEKRFNKSLRLFGSILCVIEIMTWLPIVIYVPALAFNQVTGVNVHIVTPIVCIVCIFYTCVGGLRAVVWTDVIQTTVMFGSMLLVIIKGTLDIGGFSAVWQKNLDSGRIELPVLDMNPLTRHTVWSLIIGGFVYFLQTATINQTMLQRYLALPTLKSATRALWIYVVEMVVIIGACAYSGMLIYATYHSCDPLTTKLAKAKDQLLPLLVMDILGKIPGLPGLFLAGIFSAALSSLSTALNSMAAVVLEDFIKPFYPKKLSDSQTNIVIKLVVVIVGVLSVGLAFLVEKMGTVLQLTISLSSITSGPGLGIFSMGILLPWISSKGALYGGITSLIFMGWLCINVQTAIATGALTFPGKPVTTEGCQYEFTPIQPPVMSFKSNDPFNITGDISHPEEVFMLYRMSYLWQPLIGALISIGTGILVTFCTGWNDPHDVDPILIAPFLRKLIKPRQIVREPENSDDIIEVYSEEADIKAEVQTLSSHNIQMQKIQK